MFTHTKRRLPHDSKIPDEICFENAGKFLHRHGKEIHALGRVIAKAHIGGIENHGFGKKAVLIDIAKQINDRLFVSDCKLIAACKNAVRIRHFPCRLFGTHAVAAGDKYRIAFGSKTVRTRKSCSDCAAGHKHSFFHK